MRVLIIILNLVFALLNLAIPPLAKNGEAFNPFLPYDDLLSSYQVQLVIKDGEFFCTFILMEAGTRCSLYPKDALFSEIRVWLRFDVPNSISFHMLNDSLRVGDLMLLWGEPETISSFYIHWHERNGVTPSALVPTTDRLNHFTPVQIVSFTF